MAQINNRATTYSQQTSQQQQQQQQNQQQAQRQQNYSLGVSQIMSDREPDDIELKRTDQLRECLKGFDLFETDDEMQLRCKVLNEINKLSQRWIKDLSIDKRMPPDIANQCQAKIFTFGSYRLGVHNRGADIDTLLVAPKHVERDDFFDTFQSALTKMDGVEYVRAVRNAFVPVLKTKILGIELDILFSTLALRTIPSEQELCDTNLLRGLDQQSIRSLNGCRVTDEILNLVPQSNLDSFRLALRAIKLWAKKRGIYSNVLGYLGGVSWAILTARTCQLYPKATAATIVNKLFFVFANWNWPYPVLLVNLCDNELGLQVWDPRSNPSDKYHVMPIITPSYPQQNTTFNVTRSTRTIITDQFKQARDITDEIIKGTKTWDSFFEPIDFFGLYSIFLTLKVSPQPEWVSLVESKIRTLVQQLETNPLIQLVHTYPYPYSSPEDSEARDDDLTWCIGLQFTQASGDLNLTTDVVNFRRGSTYMNPDISLDSQSFRRNKPSQLRQSSVELSGVVYSKLMCVCFHVNLRKTLHVVGKQTITQLCVVYFSFP